jgi:dimeric dUTPase (all-alpha-NTP-PPase superfamily)
VPNRKPNEYNKKPMTGNFSLPSLIISKNVSKQFKLAFIRVKAIIISSLHDGFILKG